MKSELAILNEYLLARGLRMTKARKTVLEAFLSLETHVDADAIYAAAKKLDSGIGQSTVFRTIKVLADAGLARVTGPDDSSRQYEHNYNHSHHDHLICSQCGTVVEFFDADLEAAQNHVYQRYGFEATGHILELYGLCPKCIKK